MWKWWWRGFVKTVSEIESGKFKIENGLTGRHALK